MEDGNGHHRAKGRVAEVQGPDSDLGRELEQETSSPGLPCSSLALLLASLAPSSSQASSLSKSLQSWVLHCCEVRRSLGGGWWETARRRLIGF